MSQTTADQTLRQQGLEALKRGQLDTAINIFSRMLAANSSNVEAMAALGTAYSQKGLHDQALKLLDRTVQLKPSSAALHFNRGLALERAGKKLLAGEAYEQTLKLNDAHTQARQRLEVIEATLSGNGLPTAAPGDGQLPCAAPEDEIPAADFDEEVPSASPDDAPPRQAAATLSMPSLAAELGQDDTPAVRPSTPAPKSRPLSPAPPPAPDSASAKPPKSRPSLSPSPSPGPSPSPAKASPSPKPSPGLPPLKPTLVEQPAGPGNGDDLLDVLPADGPVALPAPTPTMRMPNTSAPVYQSGTIAAPPTYAGTAHGRGRAAMTLAEGETFESWVTFEVASVDSRHLTLRSKNAMAFLWIIAAPFSLILAALLVVYLIQGLADGATIKGKGLVGLFFGLIFVVGLCIAAIYKLRQIGSKLVLDGGAHYVEQSRWFGMSRQTWSAEDLGAVQVTFTRIEDDGDDVQELKVGLLAPDGGEALEIGEEKSTKEESAVLLTVAAYASKLLGIPLQIEGRPREACDGLNDVHSIVGRPDWNTSTTFDTLSREEARRSGYVRAQSGGGLAKVGMVIHGVFGLSFVALALLLAYWGAFPWEGALVCAAFVGVGIILFINGLSGIRERQIYARHGITTRQYKGSTAVMIGWGQIFAGAIPVLAIPLVLLFQTNWGKAFSSSPPPPVAASPGPSPTPGSPPPPDQRPSGPPDRTPPDRTAPITREDPVDKAIAVLQGNDEFAKNRAAEDLARTPPNSKQAEVAKLLAANLNSQNPFTRSSCLKALTTWAGKDEIAVMIKHVDHEDVGFRREVIETLGKMKVADASEPIAERLADFFARPQAADALTKIGAPAEKAVADKLRHQDAQVRQEAAKILMRIATKESVPALRAACDDEDRAVGSYARVALRRLGEDVPTVASGSGGSRPRPGTPASSGDSKPMEGMDKLLEDLNSPFDSAKRRAACEVLVKKEPAEKRDEVAVALNRALEDREPLTRRAAVRALATWGTKENIPNLVKLLEDQDSFVRYATFETLAKFKDERAIDPIAKRLENSLDRPEASKALQEMGSMVEKIVILGLRSRDPLTRAEVCIILKAVGTKESVATLNQFVIANRNGDRKTAGLADEAIKAINEREKDRK